MLRNRDAAAAAAVPMYPLPSVRPHPQSFSTTQHHALPFSLSQCYLSLYWCFALFVFTCTHPTGVANSWIAWPFQSRLQRFSLLADAIGAKSSGGDHERYRFPSHLYIDLCISKLSVPSPFSLSLSCSERISKSMPDGSLTVSCSQFSLHICLPLTALPRLSVSFSFCMYLYLFAICVFLVPSDAETSGARACIRGVATLVFPLGWPCRLASRPVQQSVHRSSTHHTRRAG